MLVACGDVDPSEIDGPRPGVWQRDVNMPWTCVTPGTGNECGAPWPYVSGADSVVIGNGGRIAWPDFMLADGNGGVVEHVGVVDELCIRVPAKSEIFGFADVERAEYGLCLTVVGSTILRTRSATQLRFDVGTPSECGCAGGFLFAE